MTENAVQSVSEDVLLKDMHTVFKGLGDAEPVVVASAVSALFR